MKPSYTWDVRPATCIHCGETKPLESFGFVQAKSNRYRRRMCNKCLAAIKKKHYMKTAHTSHP